MRFTIVMLAMFVVLSHYNPGMGDQIIAQYEDLNIDGKLRAAIYWAMGDYVTGDGLI